jgi:GT2 family glycosyltransferase
MRATAPAGRPPTEPPAAGPSTADAPHVVAWLAHGAVAAAAVPGPLRHGLSVVVCTYKRPASVRRFLEAFAQQRAPVERLVLVDASPDDATEQTVREHPDLARLARGVVYGRVTGPLAGLTRQRNFAMRWVDTDLVAFFDDDIVLGPDCCAEMERVHRARPDAVGVAAVLENERRVPGALWRVRRMLGIVPTLQPGRYCRSGMSTPWDFLPVTTAPVAGDWLPGCAMMWRTAVVREIGFNERFAGYANGEDLEFSLAAGAHGALLVAGGARALHLHESAGRPDPFQMGYATAANAHAIHRRWLRSRRRRDAAYFAYAFALDTLVRGLALVRPRDARARWGFVRGRLRYFGQALAEPLRGRRRAHGAATPPARSVG